MDRRQIENIEDYKKNALVLVSEMRPVTYCKKGSKQKELGIVADDLRTLEPHAVNVNGQGVLSVDYESLSILLVKAIKELKVAIELLKEKKEIGIEKAIVKNKDITRRVKPVV